MLGVLVVLFVLSILLRLPNLNRPLAGGHEWITAHTLIVLDIWNDSGMGKFYYSPTITWQNPGDKGISWENYRLLKDQQDNYYHTSYPPLGYYLPYAVFKIAGVAPNPLGLELFNLALGGISAALIYLTVRRLYRSEASVAWVTAGWATISYMFTPAVLWFQCNTYFLDMLMQPLFLLFILCGATLLETDSAVKYRWWWLAGVVLGLMAFTEWIALFCYATLVGLFILQKKWWPHWRGLLLLGAAVFLAFAMVLLILTGLTGLSEAVHFLLAKYLCQSGLSQTNSYDTLKSVYHFGQSYLHYFFGLILWLATLFVLWLKTRPARPLCTRTEANLLMLSAAPVFMHHAALFGFTLGNDYSSLKAAPFFCFLLAIFFKRLWQQGSALRRISLVAMGTAAMLVSIAMYYHLFNPRLQDTALRDLGQSIAKIAGTNDVICLQTPVSCIEPQISFYARRSILYYKNDRQVLEHLNHYGVNRAAIIRVNPHYAIQDVRWLQTDAKP